MKLKKSTAKTFSVSREVLEDDDSVTRDIIMKGFQGIPRGMEGWYGAVLIKL